MMLSLTALASIESKIIGSNIKQALLPNPVGRQPNTSLLRTKLMIMLVCSGFNSSYPHDIAAWFTIYVVSGVAKGRQAQAYAQAFLLDAR